MRVELDVIEDATGVEWCPDHCGVRNEDADHCDFFEPNRCLCDWCVHAAGCDDPGGCGIGHECTYSEGCPTVPLVAVAALGES